MAASTSTASESEQRGEITTKFNRWKRNEVRLLIAEWSEPHIQAGLRDMKRNISVFKNLQGRLKEHGYIRTAEQIKLKLRKLKKEYLKVKDHNGINGLGVINCDFFEELDAILGTRDMTENDVSIDSQEEDESPDSVITIPEIIIDASPEDTTDTEMSDVNNEKTAVQAKTKMKNASRDFLATFMEYINDRKEKERKEVPDNQLIAAIREDGEQNRLLLKELSAREMEHEAAMMKMFTEAIVSITQNFKQ
ncbi:hypothetical protein CHUAL_005729 [Chamberlinius hualienensis]